MKRLSKKEKLMYKNAELFHSLTEVLNNSGDYVFVGAFANIGHKHFRGCPLFEVMVGRASENKLRRDIKKLGLTLSDQGNEFEVYSSDLLLKIHVTDNRGYFEDRLELDVKAFSMDYKLYFPSLKNHKKYLKKSGDFFSLEDIRLLNSLDDFDTEIFNASSNVELFFNMMYMHIKSHNHSNGSSSCDLCRQVDLNRRGV